MTFIWFKQNRYPSWGMRVTSVFSKPKHYGGHRQRQKVARSFLKVNQCSGHRKDTRLTVHDCSAVGSLISQRDSFFKTGIHFGMVPIPVNSFPVPVNSFPIPVNSFPIPVNSFPIPVNSFPVPVNSFPVLVNSFPIPVNSFPTPVNGFPIPVNSFPIPVNSFPIPVNSLIVTRTKHTVY